MNVPIKQIMQQNKNRDRNVPTDVIYKMFERLKMEYAEIGKEVEELPNAKACDIFVIPSKNEEKENESR